MCKTEQLKTREEANRKNRKTRRKKGKKDYINYLNNTKVPVSIHKEDKHQPASHNSTTTSKIAA
jgi:hypothetical protein